MTFERDAWRTRCVGCYMARAMRAVIGAVLLAVAALPSIADAASVTVTPAAPSPGATLSVSGLGFPPGRRGVIRLGQARPVRFGVGAGGGFDATLGVSPRTGRGPKRLVVRAGGRRVATVVRVIRAPRPDSTLAAHSGGARVWLAPNGAAVGSLFGLRGWGFPRRTRVRLRFAGVRLASVRAGRRGRFSLNLNVPPASVGTQLLTLTARGVRVTMRFAVVAAPPTPPPPAPAPPTEPVIAAAGDIACGAASPGAACRQMATSDLVLALRPAAVLALGDTQYEAGQYGDFLRSYDPSWGRFKAITHPAVGNHEYLTTGAAGYFDYFNGVGAQSGPAGERSQGYYAFDLGGWRVYALNSNCSQAGGCHAGSPQERWLRADLAAQPRACTLAFMHHPLFTSDAPQFEQPAVRPLWHAFFDAGGDVILVGHSHFYERYAPQDPDGRANPTRGIRQFIVGTGGRNVYPWSQIKPNSESRTATFGVLEMTLHASSYSWRFVPLPGEPFTDAGSQPCH